MKTQTRLRRVSFDLETEECLSLKFSQTEAGLETVAQGLNGGSVGISGLSRRQ